MRAILSGSRGLGGLVLVILIAWALLSVIFLTGTLLAARSIDRSVNTAKTGINPVVGDIGKDSKFIDQARTIADTSGKILKAAKPLSAQLNVINRTARDGIDPKLKSVLGRVGDINEVAGSINTNVLQIGSTVGSILGSAGSINGSVLSINSRGRSILRRARSINASVDLINSDAGGILSNVQSIDIGVAEINRLGNSIDSGAKPIAQDLNDVLKGVGRSGTEKTPGTILYHANNIDCSVLLNNPTGIGPLLLGPLTTLLSNLGLIGPIPPGSTTGACVP